MLFIGLAYYQGTPTNTIGEVVKHSPADQAGLHKGDKIVEIGDHKIKDFSEIRKVLDDNKTSKTTIKVQRDHHLKTMQLEPKKVENKISKNKSKQVTKSDLHLSWSIVSLNQSVMEFIISLIKVN